MGRPRLVHRALIPLLLLAACGGGGDKLEAMQISDLYAAGSGGEAYGPKGAGAPGKITGKVRFEGKPFPPPKKLDITTVDGFCVRGHPDGLMSETFLMGDGGVMQNVIVYVKKGASGGKWDVPKTPVVLDQVKCQYIPHVAVLQIGQDLIVKSSDSTNHNVHIIGPNGETNESMIKPGQLAPLRWTKPEVAQRVFCEVHGWMESYVAVLPHPFHAITAADGTFTIENVPPGVYQLAAWQERLKEKTLDVTVPPGGTVTIPDIVLER